jgi:S1-C subfamily serine protease
VLRIKPPKQPAVALGDSDKVAVGERAAAIGNPLGLEPTLIEGVISARRAPPGKRMIQISAPVARGNAGGPLLNSRGEVIGVSTGVYQGRSMLAIPINDLRAMLGADDPKRSRAGAR